MAVTAQRHEGVGGGDVGSRTHDAIALLPLRGVPELAPTHVVRPRLHQVLDGLGPRHLVLVTAPAGSGKSELVAAWVRSGAGGRSAGWVTLQTGDDGFWLPLVDALRDAGVDVPPHPGPGGPEQVDAQVLADLAEAVRRTPLPLVVVLDNLRAPSTRELAQLDLLLRLCGGQLTAVLTSRVALPVAPRCRLEGTVLEIGATELAWSDEEACVLLERLAVQVDAETVGELNASVSGWGAGLVLLGRLLAGEHDIGGGVTDLMRHTTEIEDYLVSEVLDTQPARIRHFLLATSSLETLCPDAVERLLGTGARQTLRDVVHGNAFVEPVPGRHHCFRYQQFFRDALVAQHALETTHALRAVSGGSAPTLVEHLTPRELEVLAHLDELLTTEEMAATMFVSVNTVRTHVRSVLRKLGVDRRNAAVRLGREIGLIPTRTL